MIFINAEQGSEAWHQARSGVITASTYADAVSTVGGLNEQQATYVAAMLAGKCEAAAMAEAGYKARPKSTTVERALNGLPVGEPSDASNKLAIATAIERISGQPYGDIGGSFFATERGHEGEAFARMRYEERRQIIVDESGLVLTDDRLFGYSTDGFVDNDGLIEVKVPLNALKVLHIIETGDLSEYMHQMQGGMWVTGRKWCDFLMGIPDLAALNNGNELYIQRVYRDDDFIEKLEVDLWSHAARVRRFEKLLRTPFATAANDAALPVLAVAA